MTPSTFAAATEAGAVATTKAGYTVNCVKQLIDRICLLYNKSFLVSEAKQLMIEQLQNPACVKTLDTPLRASIAIISCDKLRHEPEIRLPSDVFLWLKFYLRLIAQKQQELSLYNQNPVMDNNRTHTQPNKGKDIKKPGGSGNNNRYINKDNANSKAELRDGSEGNIATGGGGSNGSNDAVSGTTHSSDVREARTMEEESLKDEQLRVGETSATVAAISNSTKTTNTSTSIADALLHPVELMVPNGGVRLVQAYIDPGRKMGAT
jgi:hypothetical protein